jgi:hypothetical protein
MAGAKKSSKVLISLFAGRFGDEVDEDQVPTRRVAA